MNLPWTDIPTLSQAMTSCRVSTPNTELYCYAPTCRNIVRSSSPSPQGPNTQLIDCAAQLNRLNDVGTITPTLHIGRRGCPGVPGTFHRHFCPRSRGLGRLSIGLGILHTRPASINRLVNRSTLPENESAYHILMSGQKGRTRGPRTTRRSQNLVITLPRDMVRRIEMLKGGKALVPLINWSSNLITTEGLHVQNGLISSFSPL